MAEHICSTPRIFSAKNGRVRFNARVISTSVIALASAALMVPSTTAFATTLSATEAEAAKLSQQIAATGQQIDALDQQYQAAEAQFAQISQAIINTQNEITTTQSTIKKDRSTLKVAALKAYVTAGSTNTTGPFFGQSETKQVDTNEYNKVVTGDLTVNVSTLTDSLATLTQQRQSLHSEQLASAQAVAAARAAYGQAQSLEAQQSRTLKSIHGQLAILVSEYAAQGEAAAAAAALARLDGYGYTGPAPAPAPNHEGTAAVAAAETQLGVRYIWAAEDPGVGFDCSGLTAWAWGQAGIPLPHYSGAQFQDTIPVPLNDLQPGDLLFYGYHGDAHVAMYIGGGQMIEAPYTGAVIHITSVRLGTGFAGAGRP